MKQNEKSEKPTANVPSNGSNGNSLARRGTINELKFDANNFNGGTEYGTYLLRQSIERFGVARGVVAASDGTLVGGNHVTEMLGKLGFEEVIFVPTDGKTLVVTQRMDIEPDTKAFHELALADNRVGQINLSFDNDAVNRLASGLEINLEDWGMGHLLDQPTSDDADEPQHQASTDERITFMLTRLDMFETRRALDTAMIEHDVPKGKQADSIAFMHIITEYMDRRR